MSQHNVERVKSGFAAHNRGDLDALVELYDPDAVFETLLLGIHHGNEAIRLIYEENQRTLSGYDVVPVELIDAGDKVVAVAQAVGSGPASQIAVDEPFAFVFTFKGERIVREQAFRNREEALQEVRLTMSQSIAFAAPLLPGKTDADREALASAQSGERKAEHEASRRRAGITREAVWLQSTPDGDVAVVLIEADDVGAALGTLASSQEPYDVAFREHIKEVHGMDLSEGFPPPEQLLDFRA
jgi:ketosteroid isomerase-like protein